MRRALLVALSITALAACSSEGTIGGGPPTGTQRARVRNAPPASCTDQEAKECPPLQPIQCPDGTDPTIDYDSGCCPHFSCQRQCDASAAPEGCTGWPAPMCPPGTDLWIGTGDDCCAVYRCQPGGAGGAGGAGRCAGQTQRMCPPGRPSCGPGVEPMVVGEDASCCPIYQCPCDSGGAGAGGAAGSGGAGAAGEGGAGGDPGAGGAGGGTGRPGSRTGGGTLNAQPEKCGCTYPSCPMGEVLVCEGMGVCGYPCACRPRGAGGGNAGAGGGNAGAGGGNAGAGGGNGGYGGGGGGGRGGGGE